MNDPARVDVDRGTSPLAPGTLLASRFRLKAFLRSEGETQLYVASDAISGQDVALRAVPLGGPARAVLERDLSKVQRISHKNLLAVVGVASQGDLALVATELADGNTLRQIMDAQRAQGQNIGAAHAYALLGHVASALEEAHQSLAHGGLNPENIWVTATGRVKVAELGLAGVLPTLARRGGAAGSPGGLYTAPEVARGNPASARSDVYSLGAILFELVTGTPPLPPLQPPSRIANGVSVALDQVVGRALMQDPEHRFGSPAEMMRALAPAVGAPEGELTTPAPIPVAGTAARATAGRSFDVASMAGLSQEEARWLVQKDRLDFGPFSLQQVMTQLSQGVFRSSDIIVDMDSGARKKIKEHAQLAEFAVTAERRLEQARRAQAEQNTESVERKKSRAMLFIIGGAVIALSAGLGLYLTNRKDAQQAVLASRVGEADIDQFLKNVKLDFPTSRRPAARRAARGGSKDDPFSSATVLGDVTQAGGDEILGDNVIQKVMMANYRKLVPCIMEEKRRSPGLSDVDFEFVVLGSGKVSAVKVNGQRNGPFPGCVLGRMQSFDFPKYNGSKTIASWSMSLR
jgi:eukaryotic-like serine/threonine-protein kinase